MSRPNSATTPTSDHRQELENYWVCLYVIPRRSIYRAGDTGGGHHADKRCGGPAPAQSLRPCGQEGRGSRRLRTTSQRRSVLIELLLCRAVETADHWVASTPRDRVVSGRVCILSRGVGGSPRRGSGLGEGDEPGAREVLRVRVHHGGPQVHRRLDHGRLRGGASFLVQMERQCASSWSGARLPHGPRATSRAIPPGARTCRRRSRGLDSDPRLSVRDEGCNSACHIGHDVPTRCSGRPAVGRKDSGEQRDSTDY